MSTPLDEFQAQEHAALLAEIRCRLSSSSSGRAKKTVDLLRAIEDMGAADLDDLENFEQEADGTPFGVRNLKDFVDFLEAQYLHETSDEQLVGRVLEHVVVHTIP